MNDRQAQAFKAALSACERLRSLFPSDRHLEAAIQQLKGWQQGQQSVARTKADDVSRRNIDRAIRPLSEDVAALVHDAEVQAEQLHLT